MKRLENLKTQKKYTLKELNIEALENELNSEKKEFNELKGKSNYLLINKSKERKTFLINELKN